MPKVIRQKATSEEIAEARGEAQPVARQKATTEEIAEARGAPEAPANGPSTASAGLHGAVQGGTLGFADEFAGLVGAALRKDPATSAMIGYPTPEEMGEENIFSPTGYGKSFADDYRGERDAQRAEDEKNRAAHPIAYGLGEVAGTLAVPMPGAGNLKGAARATAYGTQGAGIGGLSALGRSEEDLTKGNPGALDRAERDMGVAAGVGGAAGVLGGKLADWIAGKGAAAKASREFANNKTLEGAFNSARGSLGGETSSAARTLELLEKAASDPSLPEDISRSAAAMLAGPDGAALKAQVVRSSLGRFPDQLGRIQSARDAMTEAAANWNPENVAKMTAADLSPGAAVKAIGSRLKTLGERSVPVALGTALGGPGGAVAGTLLSGTMGRPTTVVGNMMKAAPVVYNASRAAEPFTRAMSKEGAALAPYLDLLDEERK